MEPVRTSCPSLHREQTEGAGLRLEAGNRSSQDGYQEERRKLLFQTPHQPDEPLSLQGGSAVWAGGGVVREEGQRVRDIPLVPAR